MPTGGEGCGRVAESKTHLDSRKLQALNFAPEGVLLWWATLMTRSRRQITASVKLSKWLNLTIGLYSGFGEKLMQLEKFIALQPPSTIVKRGIFDSVEGFV